MKLNLAIIADELTDFTILERSTNPLKPLTLQYPMLYTAGMAFCHDRLYIARGIDLPPVPSAPYGASIICLGYTPSVYHAREWSLICLDTNADLHAVLDAVLKIFSRYDEIEKRVDTLLFSEDPFRELGSIAFHLFQNPVYATDAFDKILFLRFNPARTEKLERYTYHNELKYISPEERDVVYMDAIFQHVIREEPHAFYSTDAMKIYGVCGIIYNLYDHHVFQASLWIEEVYHSCSEKDYVLLEWIGEYLRRLMKYESNRGITPMSEFDQTIEYLLTPSGTWDSRFHTAIAANHWKKEDPFICVCTSRTDTPSDHDIVLQDDVFSLHCLFRSQYVKKNLSCIVQVINLRLEPLHSAQIEQRLRGFYRGKKFVSGISTVFHDLADVRLYFSQAEETMKTAIHQGGLTVKRFENTVLDIMLQRITEKENISFFIVGALRKLIAYDCRTNGDLVSTLRCYMECDLSPTRTGESMHIARTTCLYRIGRITEITGFHFDDPQTVLYLKIIFSLKDFDSYLKDFHT